MKRVTNASFLADAQLRRRYLLGAGSTGVSRVQLPELVTRLIPRPAGQRALLVGEPPLALSKPCSEKLAEDLKPMIFIEVFMPALTHGRDRVYSFDCLLPIRNRFLY